MSGEYLYTFCVEIVVPALFGIAQLKTIPKKLPVKPRLDEAKDSESGSGGTADQALWDALDRNDEDQNDEDDAIQSSPEVVSNEGGALLLSPAVAPGDNREFRRLRRGAPRNYNQEGDHEMTIVTSKSDAEELAIDGM